MKHRRFSEAKWALNRELVSEIEGVAATLAPQNPLNLHRRLFSNREYVLYEKNGNWDEQRQKIEESRHQAIKDILAYGGIAAAFQLAQNVESPSILGQSLGVITESGIDESILPSLLETENSKLAQLSSGFVWRRQYKFGWSWVDGLDKSGWSVQQIAQFLSYLPFTKETWDRAFALLGGNEEEYWNRTSANPYEANTDLGTAIDKLIAFQRPNAAIDCLARMIDDKQKLDKSRSVKTLLAAVSSVEPKNTMDVYHIVEIIKALQEDAGTDQDDLFRIEWAYLSLLDEYNNASPKLLENRLASDAAFFCELIRLIYRSKKEIKSEYEPSEQEKSAATNAWRLLHEWKTPPGMQPDGVISSKQFKEWLEFVKESCDESGHLEVALTHVGQVLLYSPADKQGLWIDQIVAEALNSRDADEMRNGFCIEISNSRGAHWVDPTGNPERDLAGHYRKKAEDIENAGYHRFSAALRSIADSYDREAERIIEEHKSDDKLSLNEKS